MQRRLAAIVAADVVGYSRMIRADEAGTLDALRGARAKAVDPAIAANRGRIVKLMGDGLLIEFTSAVDAVAAAVAMQQAMTGWNADRPEDRRIVFRIGVNLGDVVVDGDDIQGDGVNVAARLESLAQPGAICVSDAVHEQVRDRLDLAFSDLGRQRMKNIDRPVQVWQWRTGADLAPIAPKADAPDKPSIAVLPFDNMSGDPEQEFFADGITEDVITDLSKISGLIVIARNSTFTYKGKAADARDICRDLNVRYLLEGSVRRAGPRVRINAQLIDGTTGAHLWADRFDGDLEDIFAVQDDINAQIVAALKVALTPAEQTNRAPRGKVDPEAYECLIRGRALIYTFSPQAMVQARAQFDRTLELDSGLAALAYAGLSLIDITTYFNGWNNAGPAEMQRALELAQRAVAEDPNEPFAHHALSIALMRANRSAEAADAARRALDLDPNFAGALVIIGGIKHATDHNEEAIDLFERALRFDPKYQVALQFIGRAQLALGRYDDAEKTFRKRLALAPGSDTTRLFLAALYGLTNRPADARQMWDELNTVNPGFSLTQFQQRSYAEGTEWNKRLMQGLRAATLTG